MALTLRAHDGTTTSFREPAVVGRAVDAALCVNKREVSTHHAELRWTEGHWYVRDLGSTNGTYVDGKRLATGETRRLAAGTQLGFASRDGWTVVAAHEPSRCARSIDGEEIREIGGVIAIPGHGEPLVMVVAAESGWRVEWANGRTDSTEDGAVLDVAGTPWTLSLPSNVDSTTKLSEAPSLPDVVVHFTVSRDEEHVQTVVEMNGEHHALTARSHHYTLLTLARCRLEDHQSEDVLPAEQGWVLQSRLQRMLACGDNVIYKHIYRSRREFSELGVANASDIIERRPLTGELRIGVREMTVTRR